MLSFPNKASDLIFSLCLPLPHLPGFLFSWSLLTRPNTLPLSTFSHFMRVCPQQGDTSALHRTPNSKGTGCKHPAVQLPKLRTFTGLSPGPQISLEPPHPPQFAFQGCILPGSALEELSGRPDTPELCKARLGSPEPRLQA